MPRWDQASGAPFVRYSVPALELLRMLAEARRAAAAASTTFDMRYTRLAGARGDEQWRAHSRGVAVRLTGDDGRGHFRCASRDERGEAEGAAPRGLLGRRLGPWRSAGRWTACAPDEPALLPPPPAWALKGFLFWPNELLDDETDGHSGYCMSE